MNLKYNSTAAHKLVDDIQKSNNKLDEVGKTLIKIREQNNWKDKQYNSFYSVINNTLKSVGETINNQHKYKKDLEKAINKLENWYGYI